MLEKVMLGVAVDTFTSEISVNPPPPDEAAMLILPALGLLSVMVMPDPATKLTGPVIPSRLATPAPAPPDPIPRSVQKFVPSDQITAPWFALIASDVAPSIVPLAGVSVTAPAPMFSTQQTNRLPSVAGDVSETATGEPLL